MQIAEGATREKSSPAHRTGAGAIRTEERERVIREHMLTILRSERTVRFIREELRGRRLAGTNGGLPSTVDNLAEVANVEQMMPRDYISECGFDITPPCREYLLPLIQGEAPPPYENGIPLVARLKKVKVEKVLNSHFSV